jgi:hypothetical protein
VPARGLFVLESELNEFAAFAAEWAAHKAAKLLAVSRR